jgi:hypothetical protein
MQALASVMSSAEPKSQEWLLSNFNFVVFPPMEEQKNGNDVHDVDAPVPWETIFQVTESVGVLEQD